MKDLIEKLKDKNYVRAFGLMKPEEQEYFEEVGQKNCVFFTNIGVWSNEQHAFAQSVTYAIKPDYQPEPEFVDLPIEIEDGYLGVLRTNKSQFLPFPFTHLHCLPSLPNFHCFWEYEYDKSGQQFGMQRIATRISEGKTVYARLRK